MGTCFTDMWPAGKEVLQVLWDMSGGRLGVFHWMQRITKMPRDAHCDYGVALCLLSFAVYVWDDDEITKVDAALRDSTLNGHGHVDAEIPELKRSGKKQLRSATNPHRYIPGKIQLPCYDSAFELLHVCYFLCTRAL